MVHTAITSTVHTAVTEEEHHNRTCTENCRQLKDVQQETGTWRTYSRKL